MRCPVGANGTITFPIPWAYRVSGAVPQPYFRSHALKGHRIPAQGANPGNPPGNILRVLKERRIGRLTERLTERLFDMGPDAKKRFRSHCLEGCGLTAKCGNRGRRTRLQRRLGRRVVVSYAGLL